MGTSAVQDALACSDPNLDGLSPEVKDLFSQYVLELKEKQNNGEN